MLANNVEYRKRTSRLPGTMNDTPTLTLDPPGLPCETGRNACCRTAIENCFLPPPSPRANRFAERRRSPCKIYPQQFTRRPSVINHGRIRVNVCATSTKLFDFPFGYARLSGVQCGLVTGDAVKRRTASESENNNGDRRRLCVTRKPGVTTAGRRVFARTA